MITHLVGLILGGGAVLWVRERVYLWTASTGAWGCWGAPLSRGAQVMVSPARGSGCPKGALCGMDHPIQGCFKAPTLHTGRLLNPDRCPSLPSLLSLFHFLFLNSKQAIGLISTSFACCERKPKSDVSLNSTLFLETRKHDHPPCPRSPTPPHESAG